MASSVSIVLCFVFVCIVCAQAEVHTGDNNASVNQPQTQMQPAYAPQTNPQPQPQDPVTNYANTYSPPGGTYGYEAGYGVQNPNMYDYMLASNYQNVKSDHSDTTSTAMQMFKQSMAVMLKIAGKIGFLFLAAVGVVLIGMFFSTAICYLTPLCTITFLNGYGVNKETVRSLLTPDKITATADFVQQAIDKYQKFQNVIN